MSAGICSLGECSPEGAGVVAQRSKLRNANVGVWVTATSLPSQLLSHGPGKAREEDKVLGHPKALASRPWPQADLGLRTQPFLSEPTGEKLALFLLLLLSFRCFPFQVHK